MEKEENKKDETLDLLLLSFCIWGKEAPEKLDDMLKELKNKDESRGENA